MPGVLCEHCTAVCCTYIALPLETPETRGDFDDIRWFLLHEDISVFVEDGEWYIAMNTRCRHVLSDQRCAIYARRPRVCRKYSTDDCDYHSGDYGWEQHFTSPEQLEAYARRRLGGKPGRIVKGNRNRKKSYNNSKSLKSEKVRKVL
jgi:Fe-S-cluster containining protein